MLAVAGSDAQDPTRLDLVRDEGAGLYGVFNWPVWKKGEPATEVNAATANPAATSRGIVSRLTKNDQSYKWNTSPAGLEPPVSQWRGSPLYKGLSPITIASTTVMKFLGLADHHRVARRVQRRDVERPGRGDAQPFALPDGIHRDPLMLADHAAVGRRADRLWWGLP